MTDAGGCIDHTARATADKAMALFESHEKHCQEHREAIRNDHADTTKRLDDINEKISRGVERLHNRMDDGDTKRAEMMTAFTQEIGRINTEHAKTTTRQSVMWAIGATVAVAVVGVVINGGIG